MMPMRRLPVVGERRHVRVRTLDARTEVRGRVEERVGALLEDEPPALEVPVGRRFVAGHADDVDVVVHDRGTGFQACERVGRDLVGETRRVRIAFLRSSCR